jgi:hypothetical protein
VPRHLRDHLAGGRIPHGERLGGRNGAHG